MDNHRFEQLKNTVSTTKTMETKIMKQNDYLHNYALFFDQITTKTIGFINNVESHHGSFENFAQGYKYYGFNLDETGQMYTFREWLPGAKEVYLVGEFNRWDTRQCPLKRNEYGVWEVSWKRSDFPLRPGQKLKILIKNARNQWDHRNPAYSEYMIQDPKSLIFDAVYTQKGAYEWQHPTPVISGKLRIYECHIGMSTAKEGVSTFDEFRTQVLPRVIAGGYNALQIMAISEHAYYGSFGYHVTGFYAVSSRYGPINDFKRLVDACHESGILVLLDIVHSHFSSNTKEGLAELDGTDHLYSHGGERGKHKQWDSLCFDYAKYEVVRYLISNLHWWLTEYNIDGFRFDGITSMLYLHHGLIIRNRCRVHWQHSRVL